MTYNPEMRVKVPTYEDKNGEIKLVSIYNDLNEVLLTDDWASISCWGKQRSGKSTVALWIAYFVWRMMKPNLTESELWNRVYESIVFNLSQLLYKMRSPNMSRVWDLRRKHYRIPVFIWDDFGVHSNKAITQHDSAFDEFKGAFDALGTKFAILIFTMVNPDAPTTQLQCKYTHEIFVKKRGLFKYDVVDWQQDYRGTRAKRKKDWQQEITFKRIPDLRFDPYDEMRNQLADEAIQRCEDKMSEGIPVLLKKLDEPEITILKDIIGTGPISESNRSKYDKKAIIKLKAHQLVLPVERKGHHFSLDVTNLGLDVVKVYDQMNEY